MTDRSKVTRCVLLTSTADGRHLQPLLSSGRWVEYDIRPCFPHEANELKKRVESVVRGFRALGDCKGVIFTFCQRVYTG